MKLAAIEKSYDNLSIVMIAFKNLQDYLQEAAPSQTIIPTQAQVKKL